MFGYIRTDVPHLYIKDQTLYRATYCGVCKGIGAVCGQPARMGLTYDVTFLSVLLHNLAGQDLQIEPSRCAAHAIGKKRPMAKVDEMTKKLGALNTLLAYYKYTDDIADEGKGRAKRLWFNRGFKRAKKAYPELEKIVKSNLENQERVEKSKVASVDIAADATATMMAQISDYILQDKANAHTSGLFYAIGKWIYLIDALDDYDKDKKKGLYNPFVLCYGKQSAKDAVEQNKEDLQFVFHSLFFDIREHLSKLHFYFNRDLVDNVLLRGLPAETKRIMEKPCGKACKNCREQDEKKENVK